MPLSTEKQEELAQRRKLVVALYNAGLTIAQIDEVLGSYVAANDISRLREQCILSELPEWSSRSERRRFQFRALATISQEDFTQHVWKVKQLLRAALGIPDVLSRLGDVVSCMEMVAYNARREPTWCVKLIDAIFGTGFSAHGRRPGDVTLFDAYLSDVANGAVRAPSSTNDIFETMLKQASLELRSGVFPDWPSEERVLAIVDAVLSTLTPRQEQVLRHRFQDGITLEETGVIMGVTRERARQFEARALSKMRHPTRSHRLKALVTPASLSYENTHGTLDVANVLEKELCAVLRAQGLFVAAYETFNRFNEEESPLEVVELESIDFGDTGNAIAESARKLMALRGLVAIRQEVYEKLVIIPGIEEINFNLCLRVEELELSVRTANCFENLGFRFVYQIVTKSEAFLLGTKHFGRKSLNEVKDILAELSLTLNMSDDVYMQTAAKYCDSLS